MLEGEQRAVGGAADDGGPLEESVSLEVVEAADQLGRLADRDGDGAAGHRRRNGDLYALAAWQCGREERSFLVDLLVREGRECGRVGKAPFQGQLGGGQG